MARIILLLLLSGIVQTSFAQKLPNSSKEALGWLEKISIAPRRHNFIGTFIYYADGHMETSRIAHIVDQNGEREKIEVLDGLPRIVFRNNDEMKCYLPESKRIVTEKRWLRKFFPDLLPQSYGSLNDNYYVSKGERERVTGYECQVILLEPRDNLRYGHKFWVDVDTGLVLKAAVVDADHVIEQFAFAQLDVGDITNTELLEPNQSIVASEWHTTNLMASVLKDNELEWQVRDPPAGFKKIIEMKRNIAGKSTPINHIALSDGLATVSIFIEPISEKISSPVPGFYSSRGAINIYVRILADNKITIVGEVPLETVKKIGDSVVKQATNFSIKSLNH
ncbi:sigma E regulatory protein, MucB/RseB [Nitrosomonas cryotolerans]|uniref:Sigma E regulatory protein, MucB/RseB n=1 Tax=Nitrosomonas cryotolerans ATCC 49181 TaxID=1131553 RepID=A0A1N6IM60_9PROT|nr:MucB/RseB C-terminal domain-containing protein [Nitrosomonas cryotolerans]SFP36673.1 sigma E regulatory protein, MucB/RseB [Nitrosomonas cryotolerans]SIO33128.1 sigma E regulatory protein, MucB/RseB [Nitrosomonas cryotolerans ATCC 49181]